MSRSKFHSYSSTSSFVAHGSVRAVLPPLCVLDVLEFIVSFSQFSKLLEEASAREYAGAMAGMAGMARDRPESHRVIGEQYQNGPLFGVQTLSQSLPPSRALGAEIGALGAQKIDENR